MAQAPSGLWATVTNAGAGFGMFDANNMLILCHIAPPRLRATGYGVMSFFGIASGAYLTPLLGKLKDSGVPVASGLIMQLPMSSTWFNFDLPALVL